MNTDIPTDLQRLGTLLERMDAPITIDDILTHRRLAGAHDTTNDHQTTPSTVVTTTVAQMATGATSSDDGNRAAVVVVERHGMSRRAIQGFALLVTAAAVAGVLWVSAARTASRSPGETPSGSAAPAVSSLPANPPVSTASTPSSSASSALADQLAGDGRLILDPIPPGWSISDATDDAVSDRTFVKRIYTTLRSSPGDLPALSLMSMPGTAGFGGKSDSAVAVEVQGAPGQLNAATGSSQIVIFGPLDGHVYVLAGYHITSDELLAAANTVRPAADGFGAVIADAALPAGVVERAAGYTASDLFVDAANADVPIPQLMWTNATGSVVYVSTQQDPSLLPVDLLGRDAVTDTVNGHQAMIVTDHNWNAIYWNEQGRTYFVGSDELSAVELAQFVSGLRPATNAEWHHTLVQAAAAQAANAAQGPPTTAPSPPNAASSVTTTGSNT